jgi:hypothetical protein
MEVHHHPNVEKKSFKEYLLEGLMIFIAVTMKFIAETIRENIDEHSRARSYAESMIKDLQADTTALAPYIAYYEFAARNSDTLMQLLTQSDPRSIPTGKLYWYGLTGGAHRIFVPNDATFQQMKSSGSLRYLDKGVGQGVAEYDRICRLIQSENENGRAIYADVRICRSKLFDFRYNDIANNIVRDILVKYDRPRIDSFLQSNPPMLSYDKLTFNEYVEMVRSRFLNAYIVNAKAARKQAIALLQQLQDEYHIDD